MRAAAVSIGAAIFTAALSPASASAVSLTSPPNGAETSETPLFIWELGTHESSSTIEVSPGPDVAGDGYFADDDAPSYFFELLQKQQTTFLIADSDAFPAGIHYWKIRVEYDDGSIYRAYNSPIHSFVVPDRRIGLKRFEVSHPYHCLRKGLRIAFAYSDNSAEQLADWQVDFFARRSGGHRGRIQGDARHGSFSREFGLPPVMERGHRYFARLLLTDPAGHTTRSRLDDVRIAHC